MTVKILILFALLIFCYGSTNFVEAQQSTINSESSFNYINEHHQRPNAQKNVHGGTHSFFLNLFFFLGNDQKLFFR